MIDLSYKIVAGVYTINSTFNSTSTQFNFWESKMPVWGWVLAGIEAAFFFYIWYDHTRQKKKGIERKEEKSELETELFD